jgi:hypothetical protein
MANHVYALVEIEFANPKDITKFSEWLGHTFDENITFGERIEACCNIMLDNLYPDKEDTHEYFIENLGTKWIYFDDVDQSETTMNISWTTAWSFPEKLFNKLTKYLQSEYKDFTCSCTFEDEGFGFVGAIYMNSRGSDSIEYVPSSDELSNSDSDEFIDDMISKKQDLLDACIDNVNNSDI